MIEGEPAPNDSSIRFGRMDRDQILQNEVIHARNPQEIYLKTQGLDKSRISELADLALEVGNMPALIGLAKRNKYAVADILEHNEKASEFLMDQLKRESWGLLDLYYVVKDKLSKKKKQ